LSLREKQSEIHISRKKSSIFTANFDTRRYYNIREQSMKQCPKNKSGIGGVTGRINRPTADICSASF
jgi:hypothetical protein